MMISFPSQVVIAGKLETWKLRVTGTVGKVDPIHSTGAGAVSGNLKEKKMVKTFGADFATAIMMMAE